ncbi:hypothetical protein AB0J28_27815 [Streptosporangium canum]|uniref:hypothetical protein n=1 Tax=Streptosporangium canum TaxID=324952 RepID=UPI003430B9FD
MQPAPEPWYDLTWFEWIGVAGLPLTLIGLYLTWWQARGAANSAKAATDAIKKTEQRMRANQLLVLIPQLRWIATELDISIDSGNSSLARRHLDNWRMQASHVHGILTTADSMERDILTQLQESVGLAKTAGGALLKDSNGSTLKACIKVRSAMATACDAMTVWAGANSMKSLSESSDT